jgi:lipoprotein-anchoring transpeptidase ErfK/SrfK
MTLRPNCAQTLATRFASFFSSLSARVMTKPAVFALICLVVAGLACPSTWARTPKQAIGKHKISTRQHAPSAFTRASQSVPERNMDAEARLISIYQLIGQSKVSEALPPAETLVKDFPTFALAQLVYADLLMARTGPIHQFGNAPLAQLQVGASNLEKLRIESTMRLKALRERPPKDAVPSQLLLLSNRNKHAIAVDASRSRLYLFENQAGGPKLVADYYISVGKLGLEKKTEGDLKTPNGVYFITSQLDPKTLKDFYGVGALPINYPNVLDLKRGKTGSGIWLHGTPPGQFSRPPLDSDGCVVLANPDLNHIIKTVEIRSTPVVIANQLQWVSAQAVKHQSEQFENQLQAWLRAKSKANLKELSTFYADDFGLNNPGTTDWRLALPQTNTKAILGFEIKDLNLLHWVDSEETMVATFGEVAKGQRTGVTRRQYWRRTANSSEWKIFYEGLV